MRVYLSVNKQCPNGYFHIDPSPKGNTPNFIGNFSDINCGFLEVTELIADDIIDLIPHDKKLEVFKYWYSMMVYGGKLILIGKDFIEICKSLLIAHININDINNFIKSVKSVDDLDSITSQLINVGFNVVKQKLAGHVYLVECTK